MEVRGSLSPSRAADFRSCALAFRFRTIDRLPETPSLAAVRGTVVHRVLERVFDLPPEFRSPREARALLPSAWGELVDAWPEAASMFDPDHTWRDWLSSCEEVLTRWFALEDPRRLEPAARELPVEVLDDGLLLRGIVDRLDERADGALRVVDYKTGSAPRVGFEGGALFQLRFYALVLWLTRGVVPTGLRLVYLGNGEVLDRDVDAEDLEATRRLIRAVWQAIDHSRATGDFAPNPGWSCRFCDFHAYCPVYGGTPPPYTYLPEAQPTQLVEAEPGQ